MRHCGRSLVVGTLSRSKPRKRAPQLAGLFEVDRTAPKGDRNKEREKFILPPNGAVQVKPSEGWFPLADIKGGATDHSLKNCIQG